MNGIELEFEIPIIELRAKIEQVTKFIESGEYKYERELERLKVKLKNLINDTYTRLTPWQVVKIARHYNRPHTVDYIDAFITDFVELHGDRNFRDDKALITGLGKIENIKIGIIGHEKGRRTSDKIFHNFGMAHPEGYRKAIRIMKLCERFHLPILIFIDTPGAYPGIGAEERGQAEAIARNLREMSMLKIPTLSVVIGEGGSGGALGIGVTDRILMMKYSIYSVISPEGCASILFRDVKKAQESANALKLTSDDLTKFNIVDEVIPEPIEGAHHNPKETFSVVQEAIVRHIRELKEFPIQVLIEKRYQKYRDIGIYKE